MARRPGGGGGSEKEPTVWKGAGAWADETVFSVKGEEVAVGSVVDAQSNKSLGFEMLFEGDAKAFQGVVGAVRKRTRAEVLISDDKRLLFFRGDRRVRSVSPVVHRPRAQAR